MPWLCPRDLKDPSSEGPGPAPLGAGPAIPLRFEPRLDACRFHGPMAAPRPPPSRPWIEDFCGAGIFGQGIDHDQIVMPSHHNGMLKSRQDAPVRSWR